MKAAAFNMKACANRSTNSPKQLQAAHLYKPHGQAEAPHGEHGGDGHGHHGEEGQGCIGAIVAAQTQRGNKSAVRINMNMNKYEYEY